MVVNETINATIAADTISQNPNLVTGAKDGFFFIPDVIMNFIFSIPGYRLGWIIGVLTLWGVIQPGVGEFKRKAGEYLKYKKKE